MSYIPLASSPDYTECQFLHFFHILNGFWIPIQYRWSFFRGSQVGERTPLKFPIGLNLLLLCVLINPECDGMWGCCSGTYCVPALVLLRWTFNVGTATPQRYCYHDLEMLRELMLTAHFLDTQEHFLYYLRAIS